MSFSFKHPQYLFIPFGGSLLAVLFYEFVYVKTQEYLTEDDRSEGSHDGLKLEEEDLPKQGSPKASKEKPTINVGDDEDD